MSENIKIVEDFIAAWNAIDLDAIMSFFTSDCVYHNIPMEPAEGTAAIRDFIQGFVAQASEIDWMTHHIGETTSGVVLTERTDRFKVGEKWISLPVMGIFEIRDGQISAWRDYFDVGQYAAQMAD